jgi:hypothetical protein
MAHTPPDAMAKNFGINKARLAAIADELFF